MTPSSDLIFLVMTNINVSPIEVTDHIPMSHVSQPISYPTETIANPHPSVPSSQPLKDSLRKSHRSRALLKFFDYVVNTCA